MQCSREIIRLRDRLVDEVNLRMKMTKRWLTCVLIGTLVAPTLYVLIQGAWAFALGDLIGIARSIWGPLGGLYLNLHSILGAGLAAAIVGFSLGVFGRSHPLILSSAVSGVASAYLVYIMYTPDDVKTMLYLLKELPFFIVFSMLFCCIGAKCAARFSISVLRSETQNEAT